MLDVPTILYTFWTGDDPGPVVQACWRSMQQALPNHRFHFLTEMDLPEHLRSPDVPPVIKADFARLDALATTGGVWMDASCFAFDDVWLCHATQTCRPETEVIGFGAPWDGDVLENWALVAPHGSLFLERWRDEYAQALRESPVRYCDRVRDQVPASLRGSYLPYLACHAAAAMVRVRFPETVVHLVPSAPHGPLGVQALFEMNAATTALYLLTQPRHLVRALCGSFCKIRGIDRNAMMSFIQGRKVAVSPDSVLHVDRFTRLAAPSWVLLLCGVLIVVMWGVQRRRRV